MDIIISLLNQGDNIIDSTTGAQVKLNSRDDLSGHWGFLSNESQSLDSNRGL